MKNQIRRIEGNDWGFSVFDKMFDSFFAPLSYSSSCSRMLTDVKETDTSYELKVDMPGYEKEDINLSLSDGYLTVTAKREDKEEEQGYIKKERSYSCSRSFFVGKLVTEDDVKAKYKNGTLEVEVLKKEKKEPINKNIQID